MTSSLKLKEAPSPINFDSLKDARHYEHQIYLIKKAEHIASGKQIYKLGKTDRSLEERLREYKRSGKSCSLITSIKVKNSMEAETVLRKAFQNSGFVNVKSKGKTTESWEGDLGKMIEIVHQYSWTQLPFLDIQQPKGDETMEREDKSNTSEVTLEDLKESLKLIIATSTDQVKEIVVDTSKKTPLKVHVPSPNKWFNKITKVVITKSTTKGFRLMATVRLRAEEKPKKINFGSRDKFYLVDGSVEALDPDLKLKSPLDLQFTSIDTDSRPPVGDRNSKDWWVCWLMHQNKSIEKAATMISDFLGCPVVIKEEVYDELNIDRGSGWKE